MANYTTYEPAPSNTTFNMQTTQFDFDKTHPSTEYELYQDHKPYNDRTYKVGLEDVFGKMQCHKGEPVGQVFFSEENIRRLQKQIKNEIYERTKHQYIVEEEQDPNDLLIPMRGIYMLHGKYLDYGIKHQVKDLNKKLVNFVVPDMVTEIKQYYGYLKDVNVYEPINRPMNVSNAGRRLLPSMTTMWSRF